MLDSEDILSVGKDLSKSTDVPLGHMCNEDKSPKPKISTSHESTNILLGMMCGHIENLVKESRWANHAARERHDEWQKAIAEMATIQSKAQKVGAIILIGGVTLLSTFISVVISLLI